MLAVRSFKLAPCVSSHPQTRLEAGLNWLYSDDNVAVEAPYGLTGSNAPRFICWAMRLAGRHTHNPFYGPLDFVQDYPGEPAPEPIWILLKQETMSSSGISLVKSAPCRRQITTPAPHHSVFTGRMLFLPHNQQHQSTEGSITEIG